MNQKIGVYFWLRVAVMICTLVAVLSIMRNLKKPNALAGAAAPRQSVNICPTRVTSVSVIGRFAMKQEGMDWFRTGEGQRTELEPVAVEKWFGEHCTVDAEPLPGPVEAASPLITFAYVSGLPKTLLMNAEGQFSLDGYHFRSPQLATAISALENLPVQAKPGQK